MRLLLVEDDTNITAFVMKGFRQEGFAVDHAADGLTGLELALMVPYDAAVIDLMLPRLDGLALIEEVRRRKVATPVIILSAKRSVDDRVRGLHTGSDDYLTKPFALAELLARVQALIRRATGATEPTRLRVGDLVLDLLSRDVTRAGHRLDLPGARVRRCSNISCASAGRVLSKTMILEHASGITSLTRKRTSWTCLCAGCAPKSTATSR